ncbi:septal ring lytic transglycosylase RlpA family protein [Xenophilus arseniciresistens]|uniref:Endolytic peptidoglycan transglycosylase RlpA n=1 Tax=Xenophilus arseniciresistens TaxID=1283306 RepID=A0AAE3T119_9BURK|nr:septal ring lytic transglycosylase RlpA family protein [Xenophilus arseniciresistens]MDA7416887.1 septal ring lytic transglycosylase RlpA family protein [Xenophilus arseniciresistens]
MKGAQVGSSRWRRFGAPLRGLRPALTLAALALLAACAAVPPPDDAQAPAEPAPPLRPLARQPGTPADAPRSLVPQARYDLAIGRTEDEPDDGVPGDEPPGEVYQRGGASYYGIQFHQRRTASGERFDIRGMTAAHKTLPFNTRVCVRSLVNGKEVLVRVNDRGPFVPGRVIDLSQAAAEALDMIDTGIKQVSLTLIGTQGGRCAGASVAGAEVEPPRAEPVRPAQSKPAAPARRPAAAPRNPRARR